MTNSPDPSAAPGAALALRLRHGEQDVLAAWFQAEFGAVRRLCLGFLADPGAADDAAQDALLKLYRGMPNWDATRSYAAWRNTVVLNLCRDRLRSAERRQKREQASARPEGFESPPGERLEAAEFEQQLQRALTTLAPREREVFVLIDLEQLSSAQAAEQLGIEPATLRAYLSLARTKLKERLAPALDSEGRRRP